MEEMKEEEIANEPEVEEENPQEEVKEEVKQEEVKEETTETESNANTETTTKTEILVRNQWRTSKRENLLVRNLLWMKIRKQKDRRRRRTMKNCG